MLNAALALIVWTFLIWFLMYMRRIPAMQKAKIAPDDAKHPGSLSALPDSVRAAADNYNHLHEQPVVFYALVFYTVLSDHLMQGGAQDAFFVYGAWAYVGLRVVHSLIQVTNNKVMLRFNVFVLSSLVLMAIAGKNVLMAAGWIG